MLVNKGTSECTYLCVYMCVWTNVGPPMPSQNFYCGGSKFMLLAGWPGLCGSESPLCPHLIHSASPQPTPWQGGVVPGKHEGVGKGVHI